MPVLRQLFSRLFLSPLFGAGVACSKLLTRHEPLKLYTCWQTNPVVRLYPSVRRTIQSYICSAADRRPLRVFRKLPHFANF